MRKWEQLHDKLVFFVGSFSTSYENYLFHFLPIIAQTMSLGGLILDEDGGDVRSSTLVGKREDGVEEVVGVLEPELLRQSAVLRGALADKTADRLVVDIHPELLHLIVRFGRLVIKHMNRLLVPASY